MATADLHEEDRTIPKFEALDRLDKDLKTASRKLGRGRIRSLVRMYYLIQETRKRSVNQRLAATESDGPNELVDWLGRNWRHFEDDVKKAMKEVAENYRVGLWMNSLVGIGPVLSGALLAELNVANAPTVGKFYRYGGLDPTLKWFSAKESTELVNSIVGDKSKVEDGQLVEISKRLNIHITVLTKRMEFLQKRQPGEPLAKTKVAVANACSLTPWNSHLKVLLWKIGESFVKFCNHEKQYYGTIYADRKKYESTKNELCHYQEQAEFSLATKNFGKDTEARKWYEQGKLPPARIHIRSQRYAVKIFLSHLHHLMHLDFHGRVPPEPIAFRLAKEAWERGDWTGDHRHYIEIPNFDPENPWDAYDGASLRDMMP